LLRLRELFVVGRVVLRLIEPVDQHLFLVVAALLFFLHGKLYNAITNKCQLQSSSSVNIDKLC
jgi:hypothetical protein